MKAEDLNDMSNALTEITKWRATAAKSDWTLNEILLTVGSGSLVRFTWAEETEAQIDPETGVATNVVLWEGWKIEPTLAP